MSEGRESPKNWSWKMILPSWMRRGRRANITDVTLEKCDFRKTSNSI
jgi:hypothetical protein